MQNEALIRGRDTVNSGPIGSTANGAGSPSNLHCALWAAVELCNRAVVMKTGSFC